MLTTPEIESEGFQPGFNYKSFNIKYNIANVKEIKEVKEEKVEKVEDEG